VSTPSSTQAGSSVDALCAGIPLGCNQLLNASWFFKLALELTLQLTPEGLWHWGPEYSKQPDITITYESHGA